MQSDDLNTKSWFLLGAAGVCLAWGCCTGADVTQREVCWAPQATFQLSFLDFSFGVWQPSASGSTAAS